MTNPATIDAPATAVPMPAAPVVPDVPQAPTPSIPTDPELDASSASTVAATEPEDDRIRVLLVEDMPEVAQRIESLLEADERMHVVGTLAEPGGVLERLERDQPHVIILDALLGAGKAGAPVAQRIRSAGHTTPIVMTTVPDRPLLRSRDMGIMEIVTMPLDAQKLTGAITRVDEAHRGAAPARAAGTYVVYSGKGGVGRTTIAQSLAVSLSRMPRTRVLLMDGDLHFGDLRLQLGAPDDAPSILQLPTSHITEDDLASVVYRDRSGLDVLLAPSRMEEADMVTAREIDLVLRVARRVYDVVVVDAPPTMNDMTLGYLDRADVMINVVTPEPGSIRKAMRSGQALAAAGYPMDRVMLVLNRAGAVGMDDETIARALGRPPDLRLPEDPRLATSRDVGGPPIVIADPAAALTREFGALTQALAARTAPRSRAA